MACYVDLPPGNGSVDGYACALLALLRRHDGLIKLLLRNIVEFHTERLWEELPPGWGEALCALPVESLVCLACPDTPPPPEAVGWPPELRDYVTEAARLSLPRRRAAPAAAAAAQGHAAAAEGLLLRPSAACPFAPSETALAASGAEAAPAHSAERQLLRHIKPKKRHELQRLSSVIAAVAAPHPPSRAPTVVDIGCGQGYLARMLAYEHGLDVVGVEAAQSNTDTAAAKAERLQYEVDKKARVELKAAAGGEGAAEAAAAGGLGARAGEVRFVNRLICDERDIAHVLAEAQGEDSEEPQAKKTRAEPESEADDGAALGAAGRSQAGGGGCAIVGLHACGVLTPRILAGYAHGARQGATSVIAVGCCYHKGGGGGRAAPADLDAWGPERQSWKGDSSGAGGSADSQTVAGSESFPMSDCVRRAAAEAGVEGWLGSAQA